MMNSEMLSFIPLYMLISSNKKVQFKFKKHESFFLHRLFQEVLENALAIALGRAHPDALSSC